jgi:two-component system, NtrC family, sensor kinase
MSMTESVNILMVDDQPGKLLSYRAILQDLGENLIAAASGKEALELLLEREVAIILMDVSMPDLDGFELADLIRQHPRFQRTAIIFISAVHLTDLDRMKGYQRGAMDYISVPVVPELLRAKVSVFADLYRKTRELELLNRELEQRVLARTEQLGKSEEQVRSLNNQLHQRVAELETIITERERMEQILRQRAELLDLASEAIMVRDLNGTLQFWNSGATALYGWEPDEVLGKNLHQILNTKFPVPNREIESTISEGRRWEGNLVQYTRDGREIVVACRKILQHDGKKPRLVLEICRDITASLQAEEALRRTERLAAMGRMAGIVAHEINNPLESIVNLFYLLQRHPSLDQEARRYAVTAEQELLRISHITRQTLSFYREPTQAIPVAIPTLLDDILELQSRQLQANGIRVERRYGNSEIVQGFPVELKQVFLNLITNAMQAMPAGGRLRLHVQQSYRAVTQGAGVRVSILDTGSGIRPEDAKRLFEPFFTTKSIKGTGLGLWICKGIVEKYEGTIDFRSTSLPGRNVTCFSVFIPAPVKKPSVDVISSVEVES